MNRDKQMEDVSILIKVKTTATTGAAHNIGATEAFARDVKKFLAPLFDEDEIIEVSISAIPGHNRMMSLSINHMLDTEERKDAYLNNSAFHKSIDAIAMGADPIGIIYHLSKALQEKQDEQAKQIETFGVGMNGQKLTHRAIDGSRYYINNDKGGLDK